MARFPARRTMHHNNSMPVGPACIARIALIFSDRVRLIMHGGYLFHLVCFPSCAELYQRIDRTSGRLAGLAFACVLQAETRHKRQQPRLAIVNNRATTELQRHISMLESSTHSPHQTTHLTTTPEQLDSHPIPHPRHRTQRPADAHARAQQAAAIGQQPHSPCACCSAPE